MVQVERLQKVSVRLGAVCGGGVEERCDRWVGVCLDGGGDDDAEAGSTSTAQCPEYVCVLEFVRGDEGCVREDESELQSIINACYTFMSKMVYCED